MKKQIVLSGLLMAAAPMMGKVIDFNKSISNKLNALAAINAYGEAILLLPDGKTIRSLSDNVKDEIIRILGVYLQQTDQIYNTTKETLRKELIRELDKFAVTSAVATPVEDMTLDEWVDEVNNGSPLNPATRRTSSAQGVDLDDEMQGYEPDSDWEDDVSSVDSEDGSADSPVAPEESSQLSKTTTRPGIKNGRPVQLSPLQPKPLESNGGGVPQNLLANTRGKGKKSKKAAKTPAAQPANPPTPPARAPQSAMPEAASKPAGLGVLTQIDRDL